MQPTTPHQDSPAAGRVALAVALVSAPLGDGGPFVPSAPDRALSALRALRALLRSSHQAGPDELPALVTAAGAELGADRAVLLLADVDQVLLLPLVAPAPDPSSGNGARAQAGAAFPAVSVEGTVAGRVFQDLRQHVSPGGTGPGAPGPTVWTPVLNGTDRLGVLQLDLAPGAEVDDALAGACSDVAVLLAELAITRSLYGDVVRRTRRRAPMTLPAELQWTQLPPLTFVSPQVAVAGVLAPAHAVAGDSFDYAVNDGTAHVAIVDAMGHGLEAALLSAVAVAALRNARRSRLDLRASVRAMDTAIFEQFGPDRFVTGIVGELDTATGWWRWTTCGHPPALLVRGGRVVKTLEAVVGAPLGLGLLDEQPEIGTERLQPGDRLLLYTDGVVEARDATGEFFGTDRLVDLVTRQAADDRPVAETLRRLNLAVLAHQSGSLQDDATTVLVEWRTPDAVPGLRGTSTGPVQPS